MTDDQLLAIVHLLEVSLLLCEVRDKMLLLEAVLKQSSELLLMEFVKFYGLRGY